MRNPNRTTDIPTITSEEGAVLAALLHLHGFPYRRISALFDASEPQVSLAIGERRPEAPSVAEVLLTLTHQTQEVG